MTKDEQDTIFGRVDREYKERQRDLRFHLQKARDIGRQLAQLASRVESGFGESDVTHEVNQFADILNLQTLTALESEITTCRGEVNRLAKERRDLEE